MNLEILRKLFRRREIPVLAIFEFEHGRLSLTAGTAGHQDPQWFSREEKLSEILSRGKAAGARVVLLLAAGEFSELDLKLRPDMDAEEIAATANRELGKITGRTGDDNERASWLKPGSGGGDHGLLAQTFPVETVNEWATACKSQRMRFAGAAGLYQLLPLATSDPDSGGWLMMQQYGGSAGLKEKERLLFRQLPFGLPGPKLAEDAWLTRCRQRLEQFSGRRIHMYRVLPDTDKAAETLSRELSCEIVLHSFEKSGRTLAQKALRLLRERRMGTALPPPRKRDPREAGTMLCIIMIAMTVIMLAAQHVHLRSSQAALRLSLERSTSNQQMLEAYNQGISSLRSEIERYRFQYQSLTSRRPVAGNLLEAIGILSEQQLQFTRIERLRQERAGISISGESLMQEELTLFLERLADASRTHGFHLIPEQLGNDRSGLVKFRLLLKPAGGR